MLTDVDLAEMADEIARVEGVVGVVLGGSRARGDALPSSDVDLGIYYRAGFDPASLAGLARAWAGADAEPVPLGGWGPWVDGGAWLTVDDTAVDWIWRDLDRVRQQWAAARCGECAFHVQAGHPLGFLDVAYAGELALGRILADPSGDLGRLQAETRDYPPALADALVAHAWEAGFLVDLAAKAVDRGDAAYVALCLGKALMLCAHALHARAGRWVTNEKGLVPAAGLLPGAPDRFAERAATILAAVGPGPQALRDAIAEARALVAETVASA